MSLSGHSSFFGVEGRAQPVQLRQRPQASLSVVAHRRNVAGVKLRTSAPLRDPGNGKFRRTPPPTNGKRNKRCYKNVAEEKGKRLRWLSAPGLESTSPRW